jgi:hypothetical protein
VGQPRRARRLRLRPEDLPDHRPHAGPRRSRATACSPCPSRTCTATTTSGPSRSTTRSQIIRARTGAPQVDLIGWSKGTMPVRMYASSLTQSVGHRLPGRRAQGDPDRRPEPRHGLQLPLRHRPERQRRHRARPRRHEPRADPPRRAASSTSSGSSAPSTGSSRAPRATTTAASCSRSPAGTPSIR